MIELHYYPSTAAMAPHILLEEIGVPYRHVLVDRPNNAHRSPEYLKLNPNGLLPLLVDDGLVLYETAAICLHLADRHPGANLAPALGTDGRSEMYKWLMWMTNTLQATLIIYFYPERWVDEGDGAAGANLSAHAERKVQGLIDQLEGHLARHGGPWFMGEHYTLLDAYVLTLCRWTRNFRNSPPARAREHLGPYLQRMLGRPAVQRVFANEKLAQPFV
ncbi:MAG: glutathione S-transferase [Burkholderiaceae bacterium]